MSRNEAKSRTDRDSCAFIVMASVKRIELEEGKWKEWLGWGACDWKKGRLKCRYRSGMSTSL